MGCGSHGEGSETGWLAGSEVRAGLVQSRACVTCAAQTGQPDLAVVSRDSSWRGDEILDWMECVSLAQVHIKSSSQH